MQISKAPSKVRQHPTPGPSAASGSAPASTSSYQPPSASKGGGAGSLLAAVESSPLQTGAAETLQQRPLTASAPVIKIWHGLVVHLLSISRLLHNSAGAIGIHHINPYGQIYSYTRLIASRAPHAAAPDPHLQLFLISSLALAPATPGCSWHRGAAPKQSEAVGVGRHEPHSRHAARNGSTHCRRHRTGNQAGHMHCMQTQRTAPEASHSLLRQRASNVRCVQGRPPRR